MSPSSTDDLTVERVNLFSRGGAFIVTLIIPLMQPRPDVLSWGSRFFLQRPNGSYHEGTGHVVNTSQFMASVDG